MRWKRFNADKATFLIITIPALALYTFFYIYSVIMGFFYSATDWDGLARSYDFIGISNYVKVLGNKRFFDSTLITLRYALVMVVGTIVLGVLLAVAINSIKRFKTFFKSIYFFPAMISSVAIALIWDQVFYRALPGLVSLYGMGGAFKSPLGDKGQALYAILFVNLWQALAMPTVIFLAGLQSIPGELYESAVIDGASMFNQFRYVTLPYLVPTISVNAILALKGGITAFDYAFALTGGGPARSTMLIGIKIYQDAFGDTPNFCVANTEAVLLFIVIAALSFVQLALSSRSGVNKA
jgi:raffinose/stachyose/melibiose transport system permease protein